MGSEITTAENVGKLQGLLYEFHIDKQCLAQRWIVLKLLAILFEVVQQFSQESDKCLLSTIMAVNRALFEIPVKRNDVIAQLLPKRHAIRLQQKLH